MLCMKQKGRTIKKQNDIWKQIKENQKDPEFIRAAYEFIRYHTSHRHISPRVKL